MRNFYKLLAKKNEKRKKYFNNFLFYGKEIRRVVVKLLPAAKVFVFGSVLKRKSHPSSDIDILIVSPKSFPDVFAKTKMKMRILKDFPHNPFELHLVSPQEYENWYRHFLKKDYQEV